MTLDEFVAADIAHLRKPIAIGDSCPPIADKNRHSAQIAELDASLKTIDQPQSAAWSG
ncbi:hypothetical protein ACVIGA_005551 [Bradyrhizobium sp. USDA 3240]